MTSGVSRIAVRTSPYSAQMVIGERDVPVEAPVAIELNGIAYAVMMATPCDLDDFVTGFVLSEGLASADQIGPVGLHPAAGGEGVVARLNLPVRQMSECTAKPAPARRIRPLGQRLP